MGLGGGLLSNRELRRATESSGDPRELVMKVGLLSNRELRRPKIEPASVKTPIQKLWVVLQKAAKHLEQNKIHILVFSTPPPKVQLHTSLRTSARTYRILVSPGGGPPTPRTIPATPGGRQTPGSRGGSGWEPHPPHVLLTFA